MAVSSQIDRTEAKCLISKDSTMANNGERIAISTAKLVNRELTAEQIIAAVDLSFPGASVYVSDAAGVKSKDGKLTHTGKAQYTHLCLLRLTNGKYRVLPASEHVPVASTGRGRGQSMSKEDAKASVLAMLAESAPKPDVSTDSKPPKSPKTNGSETQASK